MKQIYKNLLLIVLSGLMVTACGNDKPSDDPSEPVIPVVAGKYIVEDGLSEYSIVVPSKLKAKVSAAAVEMSDIMNKATGCNLKVVDENDVKKNDKYISLGETKQFKSQFTDTNFTDLARTYSKYFISTVDSNIYIYSNPNGNGAGVLYGVYDLLNKLVNYEYYYIDEVFYDVKKTVSLYKYDNLFVAPSFDSRGIGTTFLTNNDDHNTHLRLINTYRGKEWASGLYGHGQIRCYAHPNELDENGNKLGDVHPDWFINTGSEVSKNQLCWSAGEGLEQFCAKKMIKYFQQFPDATYFMFGQEDNVKQCSCDRCKNLQKTKTMNSAGNQIYFTNHMIDICEAWLKENQPDREVKYVIYAYYATKEAPVISSGNSYSAFSNDVIPHPNLRIFYAPIEMNFAFPLTSPINADSMQILKQWSSIANGQVIMYLYDTNFHNYFVNFNTFATAQSMYQTCLDYGVTYLYTQGCMDAYMPCFDEMRAYVESKIMWNLNSKYEDHVNNFMTHFYKEGSTNMHNFYQYMTDQFAAYFTVSDPQNGTIFSPTSNTTLWPNSLVRKLDIEIQSAFNAIKVHESTDPQLYTKLYERIVKEYLTIIYLKVSLYKSYYTEEQIADMKEIWDKYTAQFGYSALMEGGNLDGLFN